jgi:hypothetical protein
MMRARSDQSGPVSISGANIAIGKGVGRLCLGNAVKGAQNISVMIVSSGPSPSARAKD